MVLDTSRDGVTGRLTIIGSAVATVAILLGGVFSLSNSVAEVNRRIDRNLDEIEQTCLAVRGLQADIRFHLAQEAASEPGHQEPPDTLVPIDC